MSLSPAILPTKEEQWLRERKQIISGTDVAAVLGLSPWATALDVYLSKRGLVEQSLPSKYQRAGRIFERAIIDVYQEDHPDFKIERFDREIVRHPELPWAGGSLDAAATTPSGERRVVEAKLVDRSKAQEWGEDGSEVLPQHVALQAQWYMFVTGLHRCDCVALVGGNTPKEITVHRDDELLELIVPEMERFLYENVQKGFPPDIDYRHKATEDALRALYPIEDGREIILQDLETIEAAQIYMRALASEKVVKSRKNAAKNLLIERMAGANVAEVGSLKFTQKTLRRFYQAKEEGWGDYFSEFRVKAEKGSMFEPLELKAAPLLIAAPTALIEGEVSE